MNTPNIDTCMQIHNHFNVVVKDAVTGKVKQRATAYNVVLDNFYNVAQASTHSNFRYVQLGTGTGLPRTTDTTLFNRKYTLSGNFTYEIISPETLQLTLTVVSQVGNTGNFTEIGFGNTSYLMSHALFTDSEDNPIVITQTETDVLEVTAIAFITLNISSNNSFVYPTYPAKVIANIFDNSGINASVIPSRLGIGLATAIATKYDEASPDFFYMHGTTFGLNNTSGTILESNSVGKNYVGRMGVSQGNIGFYNYLVMGLSSGISVYPSASPFCYVKFPNSALFPPVTIENMSVGIGDGSNRQFNCPLDIFVKDSDLVKVDGVPLTRGVDYTIDHHSNHSDAISCTPGCIARCNSDLATDVSSYIRYKMFGTSVSHNVAGKFSAFSHNSPLLITLDDTDETIGTTINYIKIGGLRPINVSNNNAMQGAVYTLEYSTDGSIYSVATTIVHEGNVSSINTVTFPNITAKYWRLSVDITNTVYYASGSLTKDTPIIQNLAEATVLGYKGTGIVFTNPPAAGAVIEMSANIDRPYKSENYVIDLAGNFTLTR